MGACPTSLLLQVDDQVGRVRARVGAEHGREAGSLADRQADVGDQRFDFFFGNDLLDRLFDTGDQFFGLVQSVPGIVLIRSSNVPASTSGNSSVPISGRSAKEAPTTSTITSTLSAGALSSRPSHRPYAGCAHRPSIRIVFLRAR